MKELMKKVLCMVLICSILFGTGTIVHAQEEATDEIDIEKMMTDAALDWAETFQPDIEYQIREVIPVYNVNDVIASYYITYIKENAPAGYIVLTIEDEAIEVLEFSFEGEIDLYGQLKGGVDSQTAQVSEPKMYSASPFEYFVKDQNGDYYGAEQVKVTEEDWKDGAKSYQDSIKARQAENRFLATENIAKASSITDAGEPMINSLSGYSISEDGILSRHVGYSSTYIKGLTGKYACRVVALTEIAAQKSILLNNSVAETFNSLWDLTSTTASIVNKEEIVYGGTKLYGLREGMILFCNRQGKECFDYLKISPSYTYIRDAVKNGMSGMLNYVYDQTNENGEKEETGHAVSVIGYCSAKKNNVTKNFVKVYDGWNNNWRYFNLSDYTFKAYNYIQFSIY